MPNLTPHLQKGPNLTEGIAARIEADREVVEARRAVHDLIPYKGTETAILDIGPAMGWESSELYRRFCEGAAPHLERATLQLVTLFQEEATALRAQGFRCVHVGDMHELPGDWTGAFDGIFASHVIEHSPAPYIALKEMHRVLCPGGWVFLVAPEPAGAFHIGNAERFCRAEQIGGHIFNTGIDTLIGLMRGVGFAFEQYREVEQLCLGKRAYWHRIWIGRKRP